MHPPTHAPLWPHQEEAVRHVLRHARQDRWAAVVLPTASGKTRIVQTAAYCLAQDLEIRGILALTPMVHIEDGFAEPLHVRFDPQDGADPWLIHVPDTFWQRFRESKDATGALRQWLAAPTGAALTSHALFVRLDPTNLPDDLAELCLVIDEVHHNGEHETLLWPLVEAWYARGGIVVTVTATPYRSDGHRHCPDTVIPYTRSWASLAAEGRLPETVTFRTLRLVGERVGGELLAEDVEAIANYVATGTPDVRPTVLRVPGGDAKTLARTFVDALVRQGVPREDIFDAVNDVDGLRDVLREARRAAYGEGYGDIRHRIVIACQRMREGADWPFCSRVVSVGLSDSVTLTVQLVGRGARNKTEIRNYPEAWRQDVTYAAFVPVTPDADEEVRQARRTLLFAVALSCDPVAVDYARFWSRLVTSYRLPPTWRRTLDPDVGDDQTPADDALLGVTAAAYVENVLGRPGTIREVRAVLVRWSGALGARRLRGLLTAIGREDPEVATACRVALEETLAAIVKEHAAGHVPGEPPSRAVWDDALYHAFCAVAERYGDRVCTIHERYARGHESVLTPALMHAVVHDLTRARDVAYTLTDGVIVTKVVHPYTALHRHAPTILYGEQDVSRFLCAPRTLRHIDDDLHRRGLCLARLVVCSDVVTAPLDFARLRAIFPDPNRIPPVPATAYATATAILTARTQPRYDLSRRFGAREDLVTLELAARRGWRGFPGGQSLRDALLSPG